MNEPGTLLRSRWRLERLLGRGAMGDVYRAHDEVLQRPVAVKLLARSLVDDPMMLSRFQREAMSSARLAHPNVVTTLDFGIHEGQPFMLMELVHGVSLDRVLDAQGPLRPQRAIQLALDIARGLDAAHSQGVIHRDIKPGNIMVSEVGGRSVARIMDFGVAQCRAVGPRLTMTGGAVGTPGYLSPEQLTGASVSASADVFSLGVTLYEMLSGRLPWEGTDALALLAASVREPPAPLVTDGAAPPAAVSELVMAMLASDPAARPASAAEVADKLEAISASLHEPPSTPRLDPATADHSVIAVVSLSPEATVAAAQMVWLRRAISDEGGTVAHSIRREVVTLLPSAEAAMRLSRSVPDSATPRPAMALHLGPIAVEDGGVVLGAGVRAAVRLSRLASAEGVLLTEALHDAVGLGWRGRVKPRGEIVLDQDTRYVVFELRGGSPDAQVAATVESHSDGLHWRCPCSAHGLIPRHPDPQMRLRCSRCSQLLEFTVGDPPQPSRASDHPLSSIVLTAAPAATTEDEQVDRDLIAAISTFGD